MLACPQKSQHRLHENAHFQGKQRRDEDSQIQGKYADLPGFLFPVLSQQTGNQGAAAHSRQSGQTQTDVEHWQDQRSSRHHIWIVGLSHIKSIGHIVDQHDQLTDHRRDDHHPQGMGYRKLFKHLVLTDFCLPPHRSFISSS